MNEKYEPQTLEPALQTQWQESNAYVARENDARFPQGKFYACSMLPYPSGKLHMGHVRNYTLNDVLYRYKRMRGFNVLMPMGWDAFGLPAENAAMKNGIAPAAWTYENIRVMKAQCQALGLAIDWSRELTTCDPSYYKWNQWLFLKMLEKGIAYRKTQIVNWDPVDQTVLANEQVVDGRGWRSGAPVEKREIPGYYFNITRYGEELLDCTLNKLPGWSERVRLIQENWIGKSFGVNFGFPYDLSSLPPLQGNASLLPPLQGEGGGGDGSKNVTSSTNAHPHPNPPLEGEGTQDEPPLEGEGIKNGKGLLRVYTTRADTLMGVTFVAIAAEHPLATHLAQGKPELQAFIEKCKRGSVMEADVATMEKEGMATGFFVAHPISGDKVEVWIGNYVLMGYGEGAVMAVPAHDERDFAFAKKYGLPIKQVIQVPGETFSTDAWREWYADKQRGTCIHSGKYDGLTYDAAVDAIAADLKAKGLGDKQVQFRLRDWGISRQRYWGTPIPIIHCDACGPVPVPEKDLPVVLPEDLVPDGSGNPLNKCEAFLKCTCPQCGQPARRETDTMDTFVDSSWYYMRYCSPGAATMVDARNDYWMPMDQYIGGIEHAVLHLLYARFWTKVMRDLGLLKFDEPFLRLMNQGFLLNHIFYKRNDKGGKDFFPPLEVTVTHDAAGHINGGTLADGSRVEYGGVGKMGKTERNGVDPQALIDQYGADTARLFVMFVGGPEDSAVWSDSAVEGAQRYLRRVWTWCAQHREAIVNCNAYFPHPNPSPGRRGASQQKISLPPSPPGRGTEGEGTASPQHLSALALEDLSNALKTARFEVHAALKQANYDYERMQYNTVVSAVMKMLNALESIRHDGSAASAALLREGASILLRTLYPIAPHIGVSLWEGLGFAKAHGSLLDAPWPEPDAAALVRDEIEIGVQVNGKLRASIRIPAQANEETIRALALADENVAKFVEGKPLKFFKVIPGKLVSMAV